MGKHFLQTSLKYTWGIKWKGVCVCVYWHDNLKINNKTQNKTKNLNTSLIQRHRTLYEKCKLTGTLPLRAAYITVDLNRPSPEPAVRHFQVLWAVQRPVVKGPFHIKADVLATVVNRIKLLRLKTGEQNQVSSQAQLKLSLEFKFHIHIVLISIPAISQSLLQDNSEFALTFVIWPSL